MTDLLNIKKLVSRGNVRFEADPALQQSINEHGVLTPIEVYRTDPTSEVWFIHDGHRRVTGAVLAGLTEIPYVEVPVPNDDQDRMIQQFVINQHRTQLSQLEKAEVYRKLKEEYGIPQKTIAAKFGVSEGEVSIALAAVKASPAIRDAILEGRLSHSAVEPVLALDLEHQEAIAPLVIQAHTVKGVSDAVKTYRKAHGLEKRTTRTPQETRRDGRKLDPMERMAVDGIEMALRNLKLAESTIISDPQLQEKGLAAVQEIIQVTRRLLLQLETPIEPDLEYEDIEEETWEAL